MAGSKTTVHPPAATKSPPFSRPFEVVNLQRDRTLSMRIEANEAERQGIAASLGLEAVRMFQASFNLTGMPRGVIRVVGVIEADISRICVVSLDPFDARVSGGVDVKYAPPPASIRPGREKTTISEAEALTMDDDPPDPIVDGKIDLGALSVEFLTLELDPYPRKPGINFEPVVAGDDAGPLDGLRKLRDGGA